ncbi:MAG: glutamate cyclase domain-containing protein [Pseudomonadales bacterium]
MTATDQSDLQLSRAIEDLMVQRNLRGMKDVQHALEPGYYMRAAKTLLGCNGTVLIGTGFPVVDTFETDGPVGAIALYDVLQYLGARPILVCGAPLAQSLADEYEVFEIALGNLAGAEEEARQALAQLQPEVIISIERPGLSEEGGYFNMRGEDISPRCACFDHFMRLARCPTIAIGDGGNEIGMGNIRDAIAKLDIIPAATTCDELLIADVSNWAAHGIIAMLAKWHGEDLLARIDTLAILKYISARGSVDGVTRENTLTEDSLPVGEGQKLIAELRMLAGFSQAA